MADLLAIRLPKSVHIHGDMFRRMVVSGRAGMTPNPSPDALAQLNLRYDLAAMAADRCAEEGFDAIVQDLILGKDLADFVKRIASPERYLVVLSPRFPPLTGEKSSARRPDTSVCRLEPSTRCCGARRRRSATGSTRVPKPPKRRWRTSSRICNGQRSKTRPVNCSGRPLTPARPSALAARDERTLDSGLGPRYRRRRSRFPSESGSRPVTPGKERSDREAMTAFKLDRVALPGLHRAFHSPSPGRRKIPVSCAFAAFRARRSGGDLGRRRLGAVRGRRSGSVVRTAIGRCGNSCRRPLRSQSAARYYSAIARRAGQPGFCSSAANWPGLPSCWPDSGGTGFLRHGVSR